MGRPARYIPKNKNGVLVEVTCRAIGGRALLTPAPNPFKLNELVAGVIGRALEVSPLDLCSAIVSGNHYHLLCVVHEQQALSRFMAHYACNLSKEIGRLRPRGPFRRRCADAPDREARFGVGRAERDPGGRDCVCGRGASPRPAALRSPLAPRRSGPADVEHHRQLDQRTRSRRRQDALRKRCVLSASRICRCQW